MSLATLPLLLLLLLAHVLGDFVLQPSTWVDERYAKHAYSKRLYAHVAIHGVLSLAVLSALSVPASQALVAAAVIGITHFGIDLAKSYTAPGRLSWFLIDQFLHLSVLGSVWLTITNEWNLVGNATEYIKSVDILLILIGYVVVIWPFSIVIGLVCQRWTTDIEGSETLTNAGKTIGQLERFLILTFILVDQFAAIGFLLAAKSILRFGDTKERNHRKINEYILVGTMASFSITIAFGLFLVALAENL